MSQLEKAHHEVFDEIEKLNILSRELLQYQRQNVQASIEELFKII